jgi:hypothetical protein
MSKETKITGGVAVAALLASAGCTTTKHSKFEQPDKGSKAAIEYGGAQASEYPPAQTAGLVFQYPANVEKQIASQDYNVRVEADKDAAGMIGANKEGFCKADTDKATLGVDRLKRNAITKEPTGYNQGVGSIAGDATKGRDIMTTARNHDMEVMDGAYRAELKATQKVNCGTGVNTTGKTGNVTSASAPVVQAARRFVSAPSGMTPIQINVSNNDNGQQTVTVGSHASNVVVRRDAKILETQR